MPYGVNIWNAICGIWYSGILDGAFNGWDVLNVVLNQFLSKMSIHLNKLFVSCTTIYL